LLNNPKHNYLFILDVIRTMNKIKIALAQLNPKDNPEDNLSITKSALLKAKEGGADIVLFPELWTTSYSAYPKDESRRADWESNSLWHGSELYEKYLELAKKVDIAFVFTFLESNKERTEFYNTAEVISKEGKSVLCYRKTHTVDKGWESMFVAGESFDVAELETANGVIKVGVMICYDREFPEVARLLMLEGAELILTPNACNLENNRIAQFQTRAFENMLAVAMANYPKPKLNGMSVAFDGMREKGKDYNPLVVIANEDEGIWYADFDINKLRQYREKEIWGDAYRKPRLYRKLSEDNLREPFIRKDARR